MTFILPSFGASAISAVPASGGGGGWSGNTYSLSQDGSDDYISLASAVSFSGACTLSAWIKPSQSGLGIFLGFFGGTNSYTYLNSQSIAFVPRAGTSGIIASGVSISNGSWYHVMIVRDASNNITVYVDGVSRGTGSDSGSLGFSGLTDSGYVYQGLSDEYALWDSDQSSNLSTIYNSGVPGDLSSLSPLHWWRMGDNDGGTGTTITDQGSGGNDATLVNGPTFSTDVPVGPLTNTYSLSLDGTDDYVALGNSSDLAPSNITVSLWFKASGTVGTFNYLFAREGALYGSYLLRYTSANKFNIFIGHAGGSTTDITSSSTYTLTDWHHVAFTYDQTNLKLYVDGSEAASVAKTTAIDYTPSTSYGTDNTYIGKGTFADNAEGLIDEVAIFNSALSGSDITAIYNSGTPDDLTSYSPVGWWRMGDNDGGTGTTITDQGSGGNDGTLTNGPTFSTTVP